MKTFITSIAVLGFIILCAVSYSMYLNKSTDELNKILKSTSDFAQNEDWSNCEKEINKLSKKWTKSEIILSMFNDHEDVDKIKLAINELKEDVSFKDKEHIFKTLSQTKILIERLKKNETLTLENILGFAPNFYDFHSML